MSELTFPGLHGQPPAIILPLTRMADAVRGEVFARAFVAAGWRVCLYVPENDPALLHRAGKLDGARVLPVGFDALAKASEAKAFLIEASALVGLPQCLVTAPFEFDEIGADRSESSAPAHDECANEEMDERLLRATRANVAVPLALTRAFHLLRMSGARAMASRTRNDVGNDLANYPANDAANDAANHAASDGASAEHSADAPVHASVIHLLDVEAVRPPEARLVFALSQQSLLSAIPTLASAYAPGLRVVGLRTPLGPRGLALAPQQADALLYLANADTITGSSLLLDGGLRVGQPMSDADNRAEAAQVRAENGYKNGNERSNIRPKGA